LRTIADVHTGLIAVGFGLGGWPRADILALASVITAVVIAVIPPGRRTLARWWRMVLIRAGYPRHRYQRWFVQRWGKYDNPYIDDVKNLDLVNTYVSLSFLSEASDPETEKSAITLLSDWNSRNLVIEGGPGSGKSTLLRAYGVSVCRSPRALEPGCADGTPFLIQLRKLGRNLDQPDGLVQYLIDEILISDVGMRRQQAWQFLRSSLAQGRVVVMLDGLDEVTTGRCQAVLEAVHKFLSDRNPDYPTHRARVILTCRSQNFVSMRGQWQAMIGPHACTLAPLCDSEILGYLRDMRPKFKSPADGPERFMQAIRDSGTLDLHRLPLVLAMSVGLYSRRDYFEIPSSISRLYQAMIREMLDRHRFKRDPGGGALRYQLDDKYRFLRKFALHSTSGTGSFGGFSKDDLVRFGELMAPDLDDVRDPEEFVEEIIRSSGLLSEISQGKSFVFAHRSLHDYLAAEELRHEDGGYAVLLAHAADAEWRPAILFYATAQEQRQVSEFLVQLSPLNPALAARCLASAKPSNDAAAKVLGALNPVGGDHLAALMDATRSPRVDVRDLAIDMLVEVLSGPGSPVVELAEKIEGMLPLLASLAGTDAGRIAALVPQIIERIPNDPRLVEPLWRCLAASGIEKLAMECRAIVTRLLTLVTRPDGFDELSRQAPYSRDFLAPELRLRAYPFSAGLDTGHNLVTLLAWAQLLEVAPAELNLFFEAKLAGRLDRVEADRRRTIGFSVYRIAAAVSALVPAAAIGSAAAALVTSPRQLAQPFGWWTPVLILTAVGGPMTLLIGLTRWAAGQRAGTWPRHLLGADEPGRVRPAFSWIRPAGLSLTITVVIIPAAYGLAAVPLISRSLPAYFATVAAGLLVYILTLCNVCACGRRYYLYRPNPYVDIYDDPRSGHWVRPAIGAAERAPAHGPARRRTASEDRLIPQQ
jgi:hypothetical protein